jgi:hypothetical protein
VTARLLAAGLGLTRFHLTRRPDPLLLEGALRLLAAGAAP